MTTVNIVEKTAISTIVEFDDSFRFYFERGCFIPSTVYVKMDLLKEDVSFKTLREARKMFNLDYVFFCLVENAVGQRFAEFFGFRPHQWQHGNLLMVKGA